MNNYITRIQQNIEPLRQQIIQHKVYSVINDIEDLKVFTKYHVYAVWDFMSLLKSLQNSLTCTSVPWFPTGDGETRNLINEIVAGEESDVDVEGNFKSHFELYLDAMAQCGADTTEIGKFIEVLRETGDFEKAFDAAGTPEKAREFVRFTFDTIGSGKDYLQAATFTFGREDLIPGMFMSIIEDIHRNFPDSISIFKYYLERHIEVDGDHHSHLALQMTANLCGDNEAFWQEAEKATIVSLERRIALWDGVYEEIAKENIVK
ncbi:Protein of unknown function [Dyadobacter sp. SG02]|uniref:DUF3050 domain-containing protein n=1 Tax=Dyadobacter sp. SG02 TaxID=1855291 RepID=UPI0008D3690A|nr:DUF3050 domain-containing protein [Dyadobacter sp. SG02]SEJ53672.1 Protein of unknown function [Dyadobacter sp. SG02]